MRFAFAISIAALAFLFTQPACAETATASPALQRPPVVTAVAPPTFAPEYEASNTQWSTLLYIHGLAKQTGVGFGFQTPLLWDVLGLRVDYNFDRLGVRGQDPVTFSALNAGVKFQLNSASSEKMYSYVMQTFDFYFPRDHETTGSTIGFETALGVEFRHFARVWSDATIENGVFLELGLGACELRAEDNRGGNTIGDGLIARLGFRQFL